MTSKKRNHEFSNSPIHEFKVLQNVFKMKQILQRYGIKNLNDEYDLPYELLEKVDKNT